MLNSKGIQQIYENTTGLHLTQLVRQDGKELYYKKVGYNFLSVSPVKPAAYDKNGADIEQTKLGTIRVDKDYYEAILLLLCGKFNLTKWLTYGDDFDLTVHDLMSFSFPFNDLTDSDQQVIHDCYKEFVKRMPKTLQFKLNAGINVGTFNTAQLWEITDKSDMIFYKYISEDPIELSQLVENHIAKCVISDKKNDE